MEPSSVEDGNTTTTPHTFRTMRRASMEPSSVEDGNHAPVAHVMAAERASMEPSSVEDGNLVGMQIGGEG